MPLPVPKRDRHLTKQAFVYQAIRDAIMNCEMTPGERLVIDDLARRLEVSTIPVREALQMLQTERLVVMIPHVGATVAPISRESILEVFSVMEGLETVATRVATERATAADFSELEGLLATMDRALQDGQHRRWADLNTRFHLTISHLTGLSMLHEMTERVLARWGRVRRYYFSGVLVHRVNGAQEEHHAILSAMKARDFERLESIVREHNRGALRDYTNYLERTRAAG